MKNSKKWNTLPFHITAHSPFLLCMFFKILSTYNHWYFYFILNNKQEQAFSYILTEHGCKAASLTP